MARRCHLDIDIAIEIDHRFSLASLMAHSYAPVSSPHLCTEGRESSGTRYRSWCQACRLSLLRNTCWIVNLSYLKFSDWEKNWLWCSFQHITIEVYLLDISYFFVMNVLLHQITDNTLFITHYVNSLLVIMTHYDNYFPIIKPFLFSLLIIHFIYSKCCKML